MVKMTLGSSTSQGASASSISQQRVSAYEALIGSLQNFGGEEGLTGAAYDSAKNYATSILVPLLQGAILLSEGIGQAVPRLPQKYQAEVGGEDLDSAVLESEIAAYNSSLRSQHNLLRMLSSADEISPSAIQRVSQGITNTTKLRNDAMEKLQKLNAFANSSNSVFDGVVSDVEGAVQAGLAEIGSSFASFNGTFSSSSPSWAKSIKKEWKARQTILDDYNRVLKKWEEDNDVDITKTDIEVVERYMDRYPDREIPEGLKNKLNYFNNSVNKVGESISSFLEYGKESVGAFLEKTGNKVFKEGKNIGRSWSASLQPRQNGRFIKDTFAPRKWLTGKLKGVSNATSKVIGTAAQWAGKGLVAWGAIDTYNEHYSEHHNVGRAVSYSGVSTSVGVYAGSVGTAIGTSIAASSVVTGLGTGVAAVAAVALPVVGAVVVGAVATVAVKALYDNVKPVRQIVDGVGDFVNGAIDGTVNTVRNAVNAPLDLMKGVFGW